MENKSTQIASKNHPGVYLPPPLIYVANFFASIYCQRLIPLDHHWFAGHIIQIGAGVMMACGIVLLIPSLWQFFVSRNTLIPIKPARSLQTSGIYSITRNPMYLGLLFIYGGLAIFKGNLWTFLLAPAMVAIVRNYVIKREERYLMQAFGDAYAAYSKKVRRWI